MAPRNTPAVDDGSDIVCLVRKVGLTGFGRTADADQSVPAAQRGASKGDYDDGSDIVALARKVGIPGFGRFADNDSAQRGAS